MYSVIHQLTPKPEYQQVFEDLLREMAGMFEGFYDDVVTIHG